MRCLRCRRNEKYSGDWYGDLCPSCADQTDGDWVCLCCERIGNFEAMGGDGADNPRCCGVPCIRVLDDLVSDSSGLAIMSSADTFTPAERSRIMALVKSRDTTPELVVRRLVHGMGYRYRLHVRSLPGAPDLVLPRLKKVLFVSGCFWHMHTCGRCRIPTARRAYWVGKLERNAARDKRVQRALRRAGWSVLVIWECQTAAGKLERLQARLDRFLQRT